MLKKKRRAAQFFLCLMVPKAGCLKGGCLNPPGAVPKEREERHNFFVPKRVFFHFAKSFRSVQCVLRRNLEVLDVEKCFRAAGTS